MSFELPVGIDIADISGLSSAYCEGGGGLSVLLSAEKIEGFIRGFCRLIREPVFFFIELPCSADEEKELGGDGYHYRLYYLDNCTSEVIDALIGEYGSMLINDGLCRFGFGGNESGDELYVQSYKVMSVYCSSDGVKKRTLELLDSLGAEKRETLVTPWDIISKENPGVCAVAEEDGITPFDLPEMLKKAGMYFSEIVG